MVVETIKIEGNGSGFEETIKDLNTAVQELNKNLKSIGSTAEKSFDKAEKSAEGVEKQVKETGKSVTDLIKNITALGVVTRVSDAVSEAFTGNQKIVDALNTGIFTVQIAVSNLIDYFTGGKGSLRDAFRGVTEQAKELVKLQNESRLADVQRMASQLESQKLAEIERQKRDDELRSLDERIKANQEVDRILSEQLVKERGLVEVKLAAANAEYERLKNIENLVALEQANVELIDIEERIIGQRSEALMNQRSLERERLDLQKQINEAKAQEAETGVKFSNQQQSLGILALEQAIKNERQIAEEEYKRYEKSYEIRVDFLNQQITAAQEAGQTENAQYQQLLDERYQLDQEYYDRTKQLGEQRRQLNLQSVGDAVMTTQQAISAISAFYDARYANDEKNAEKAFNIQKKLSIAQAVVQGVESVVNAYATAQKSPLTALFPVYPAVAAGTAAAFAASQVALINSQQFQAASSGSANYDSGSGVPSQPANFNIVSSSGGNILVESLASQFQKPIKAYVVSGEVISGTELDRRRVRTATFG